MLQNKRVFFLLLGSFLFSHYVNASSCEDMVRGGRENYFKKAFDQRKSYSDDPDAQKAARLKQFSFLKEEAQKSWSPDLILESFLYQKSIIKGSDFLNSFVFAEFLKISLEQLKKIPYKELRPVLKTYRDPVRVVYQHLFVKLNDFLKKLNSEHLLKKETFRLFYFTFLKYFSFIRNRKTDKKKIYFSIEGEEMGAVKEGNFFSDFYFSKRIQEFFFGLMIYGESNFFSPERTSDSHLGVVISQDFSSSVKAQSGVFAEKWFSQIFSDATFAQAAEEISVFSQPFLENVLFDGAEKYPRETFVLLYPIFLSFHYKAEEIECSHVRHGFKMQDVVSFVKSTDFWKVFYDKIRVYKSILKLAAVLKKSLKISLDQFPKKKLPKKECDLFKKGLFSLNHQFFKNQFFEDVYEKKLIELRQMIQFYLDKNKIYAEKRKKIKTKVGKKERRKRKKKK